MRDRVLSALILAIGLIVGSYLIAGRYALVAGNDELVVWRIDRLTGSVAMCGGTNEKGDLLGCYAVGEDTGGTVKRSPP